MSKIMLPSARPIWDMRLTGKKPTTLVFISLIGGLNVDPTVVVPDAIQPEQCEWRWVVDLGVTLVFNNEVNKKRMWAACQSIIRNAPNGGYSPFSKHIGHLWLFNTSNQIASKMSWWRGIDAIPDYDIERIDEEFTTEPIWHGDRKIFAGIKALTEVAA